MSHSPALETPSPSATTPSTPVFRNLVHGDRNHSRSPPPTYSAKDDKFLYQPENTMIRQQHHEHSRSSDHKKHSEHEHHRESSSKDRHSQKEGSVPREHHSAERTGKEIQDSRLREMDRHNKENIGQSREFHLTGVQNLEAPRLEQDLARLSHSKGSSHRLSTGLQVSLTSSNISSTPLSGTYTEVGWHSGMGQQAPHSPGAVSWSGDAAPTSSDKSSETGLGAPRLSRKESYKAQRQNYRREKKRAASALLSSLEDPAVIILADWLKIRGSLKSWTKLWCVLKPGLLLIYKSQKAKSNHWVGTVLLSACQVIERPSKKDGFCFKLYHPMEQSIWAPRGPHNEAIGAVVQPLPTAHLIFRAPSQAAGKCWLDGLEVALRCSTMLLRCGGGSNQGANETRAMDATANHETQWSPEDLEKHFNEHDLEGAEMSESESDGGAAQDLPAEAPGEQTQDTDTERRILHRLQHYYEDEPSDDVGQSGEVIEELGEENKSLLWFLIKQVRPGMDLSKVALPTFILEPRSFLDKLSDSFYHADILASAWKYEDPFDRMKAVTTWYLSGFYRKPRGLKKPYNPVLGESFRCCWLHPNSNTRTYYVAEQVSHHPPLSAFYVSNRKEGFTIEASILAKSKFYGISTSAILEGTARVSLLPLAETYLCTSPYAHCKGLLAGTLSMELGGRVTVTCPDTNYSAEIEFRLKPMLGGADSINLVSGRIRHHKETMATLEGHWDTRVEIKDRRTQETSVLLDVSELKHRRLKRQTIRAERLGEFESQKLWHKVSTAIAADDQVSATEEKTVIEEAQRERARALGGREWVPRYFRRAPCDDGNPTHSANTWQYNYPNLAPWDDSVDVLEYESDYIVQTLSRDENMQASPSHALGAHPETEHSASETDSTNSHHHRPPSQGHQSMAAALLRMEAALLEQGSQLAGVRAAVTRLENPSLPLHRPPAQPASWATPLLCLSLAFIIQTFYYWIFR